MCIFRINGGVLINLRSRISGMAVTARQSLASTTEQPLPPQLLSVITAGAGRRCRQEDKTLLFMILVFIVSGCLDHVMTEMLKYCDIGPHCHCQPLLAGSCHHVKLQGQRAALQYYKLLCVENNFP